MDPTIELTHRVVHEIVETANDIDAYLASDVPIECYRKDIDFKLMVMKEHVAKMILESTGLPVTIKNSVEKEPKQFHDVF